MSKEKKRELNWYQANDSEAMARRLEKMAAKGWLLESVDSMWRTYRRAEPSSVRYAVTYFPDASVFDGSPTGGQETYADYCAAAGWEFVSAYGPIQYFRSTRPDPVPIETDEGEKLRSIHKTMLKTLVLAHCLLLVSVGVTIWSHTSSFRYAPLSAVSSNMTLGLYLLLAVLLVYLVAILADYFIWYFRSKASVARGGACKKVHTQARLMGGWVLIGALVLCLAGTLSEVLKPGMAIVMAYSFGMAALLIVAIPLGLKWLKKRGLSRGVVRGGYIALCVGLGVLYAAGAIALAMRLASTGAMHREPAEVYTTSYGYTWDLFRDGLPVTLEDLGFDVPAEAHCSYEAEVDRSLLASFGRFDQDALEIGSDLPIWSYQTAIIPWDWMRDLCWDALSEYHSNTPFQPAGPRCGAERAMVRGGRWQDFLLYYGDRIICIQAGWELTEEQVQLAADRLLAWS